jgi:hypothetical protein
VSRSPAPTRKGAGGEDAGVLTADRPVPATATPPSCRSRLRVGLRWHHRPPIAVETSPASPINGLTPRAMVCDLRYPGPRQPAVALGTPQAHRT